MRMATYGEILEHLALVDGAVCGDGPTLETGVVFVLSALCLLLKIFTSHCSHLLPRLHTIIASTSRIINQTLFSINCLGHSILSQEQRRFLTKFIEEI